LPEKKIRKQKTNRKLWKQKKESETIVESWKTIPIKNRKRKKKKTYRWKEKS
jgi:hypothetical protein